jgi:hypothetical protein
MDGERKWERKNSDFFHTLSFPHTVPKIESEKIQREGDAKREREKGWGSDSEESHISGLVFRSRLSDYEKCLSKYLETRHTRGISFHFHSTLFFFFSLFSTSTHLSSIFPLFQSVSHWVRGKVESKLQLSSLCVYKHLVIWIPAFFQS